MVSFALAGFAGAMKGAYQGVKDQREQKLKQLELDQRGQIADKQIAFNREELGARERMNAAQLAATQANTAATLGVQQAIATAGNQSSEKIAGSNQATTKEVAQLGANTDIARTNAQIAANKELAKMQIDAAADAGATFITQEDGTSVMMRGGKAVPMPIDPATGKPMNPAISKNDTDEMKNYKFMKTLGANDADIAAFQTMVTSKNADPALLYTSLVETFTKAQTTFGNATEDTANNADKWARMMLGNMGKTLPAAAAAPASAAAAATGAIPVPVDAQGRPDPSKMTKGQRYSSGGNTGTWNGSQIIPDK